MDKNSDVLMADVKVMLTGRIVADVLPTTEEPVKIIEAKVVQEKVKKAGGRIRPRAAVGAVDAGAGPVAGTEGAGLLLDAGDGDNIDITDDVEDGRGKGRGEGRGRGTGRGRGKGKGRGKGRGRGRGRGDGGMLRLDDQMTNFDTGFDQPADLNIFFNPATPLLSASIKPNGHDEHIAATREQDLESHDHAQLFGDVVVHRK